MARLTITNNEDIYKLILTQDKKAGFSDYEEGIYNNVWVTAHRKKRNHLYNYHRLPNGDFVACAGTLIYKNHIGREALKKIYNDFNSDVEYLRENAIGNYFVALKKDKKIYVFVDKYEVFKVYYFRCHNKWVISNSLKAVATALMKTNKLKINELGFIEQVFCAAIIGKDTIFNNIYKLLGLEYIIIDTINKSVNKKNIPYKNLKWGKLSIDNMAEEFKSILQKKLDTVGKIFGNNIGIFSTGGLDSRVFLAGFLGLGKKIKLFYGIGNSPLTNTKMEDLEINKIYAERFNLKLNLMDWKSDNDNYDSYFDEAFKKYGFYALAYGASKGFFDEFEKNLLGSCSFIIPGGYFGETYRNRPWLEKYNRDYFSIDQFLENFYLEHHIIGGKAFLQKLYPSYRKLYSYMKDKFIENAYRYNIEKNNKVYKLDSFQMFYDPYFRDAHAAIVNIANLFTCSFSIYSIYDLHEFAFQIPIIFKKKEKFVLKVLEKLYPPILEIPFFSHVQKKVLNKENLELVSSTKEFFILRFIKSIIPKGRIYAILKGIYSLFFKKNKNRKALKEKNIANKLRKYFINFVNLEQQKIGYKIVDINKYDRNLDIRRLVKISQYLSYTNRIINKEKT